jgi:hypothetical protein
LHNLGNLLLFVATVGFTVCLLAQRWWLRTLRCLCVEEQSPSVLSLYKMAGVVGSLHFGQQLVALVGTVVGVGTVGVGRHTFTRKLPMELGVGTVLVSAGNV